MATRSKIRPDAFADLAVLWRKQVKTFNNRPTDPGETDAQSDAIANATYLATEKRMMVTPIVTEADVRAAGDVIARETRFHVFAGTMPAAVIRALRHHQHQPTLPAAPAASPDLSAPTTDAERDLLHLLRQPSEGHLSVSVQATAGRWTVNRFGKRKQRGRGATFAEAWARLKDRTP